MGSAEFHRRRESSGLPEPGRACRRPCDAASCRPNAAILPGLRQPFGTSLSRSSRSRLGASHRPASAFIRTRKTERPCIKAHRLRPAPDNGRESTPHGSDFPVPVHGLRIPNLQGSDFQLSCFTVPIIRTSKVACMGCAKYSLQIRSWYGSPMLRLPRIPGCCQNIVIRPSLDSATCRTAASPFGIVNRLPVGRFSQTDRRIGPWAGRLATVGTGFREEAIYRGSLIPAAGASVMPGQFERASQRNGIRFGARRCHGCARRAGARPEAAHGHRRTSPSLQRVSDRAPKRPAGKSRCCLLLSGVRRTGRAT